MENIYTYVEKYGDCSFKEKKFTDIDNLVFSSLSYLNFSNTKIKKGNYTLEEIGKEYLTKKSYKNIKNLGIASKDAYKLLEHVIHKKRYKEIVLKDYIYNTNKDMQFCALTFQISKTLKYICFEGTNELVSGWKEDGWFACFFPIPSQKEAIQYVNKHVKLFGPNIIIGGHSKGGNLALVASMYLKKYRFIKIKKVYSNDGPGLRKKEFNSKEYKRVKRKLIHFVPEHSIVGVLLRNDIYMPIKSSKKNILSHSLATWKIEEDKLVTGEISDKSKTFEQSLLSWLDNHDDTKRIKMINGLFKVLEDANIDSLVNVRELKNIIKIIHNVKNIDKETKKLIIDFVSYNYKNVWYSKKVEDEI